MLKTSQLIEIWNKYLNSMPDWKALVKNVEPKINGNGKIYELPNPIDRPQESFCIIEMRNIKVSEPHYHANNEHEVYIILEGSGSIIVGEKNISVTTGDVVEIPPMTAHYTISNKLVFACINTPPFDMNNYIKLSVDDPAVKFNYENFLLRLKSC